MVGEDEGAALEDLANGEHLLRNNKLRLNTDKTQSMVCRPTLGSECWDVYDCRLPELARVPTKSNYCRSNN